MPLPSSSSDLAGTVLGGRYRVVERIGVGGFGAVWLAEHIVTKRSFAIKVLLPEFSERPKFAERFVREATTTSRIEHDNVVDIIDVGRTDAGALYFAMELLRGETLEQTLAREGRLPWSRARTITLQICDGLRAAHDRDIVHRDLKPANIYRVSRGGNPDAIKILDFGIAKLLGPEHEKGKGLTSNYEVLGTPLYMSPEQTAADPVDRRSDIYAVGVMLYEMLTGTRPYAGDTQVELMKKILCGEVTPMAMAAPELKIPRAVEAVVMKAMARDPRNRFLDMNAMMAALSAIDEQGRTVGNSDVLIPPQLLSSASDDTLIASTPIEEINRTLMRPVARPPAPPRPLLAVAGVVLGLLLVAVAIFGLGDEPAAKALAAAEREPVALVTPRPMSPTVPDARPQLRPPSMPVGEPEPVPPAPARPRPAPSCEAALGSALAGLPTATVRRCIRSTGVTTGDRLKLQLAGNAGGKLEVKTLESSGSREFDGCLAAALGQRRLPADASPARCQKALPYRVP